MHGHGSTRGDCFRAERGCAAAFFGRQSHNPAVAVDGLLYARSQMGISLAFHIVFAAAGVALPALMVLADIAHRRTRDPEYLLLSKQLAKGTSILFAVGA